MSKPTKVPAIPNAPVTVDAQTRQYFDSLKEAVEIRLGRRGAAEDRAVTLRELIDSGLAERLKSTPFDPNNFNTGSLGFTSPSVESNQTTPPAPLNFTVTGLYSLVLLKWHIPVELDFLSHTEIWSNTEDNLNTATLLDIETGFTYSDRIGSDASRYYWIRFVSTAGIIGPFNAVEGTLGETQPDVEVLLTVLAQSITSDQLAQSLASPIGNLPADTNADIEAVETKVTNLKNTPAWVAGGTYEVGDLVSYDGKLYACLTAHTDPDNGANPSTESADNPWKLIGAYGSIVDIISQTETTRSTLDTDYLTATDTNLNIAASTQTLRSEVYDEALGAAAWDTDADYTYDASVDTFVYYDGKIYRLLQSHTTSKTPGSSAGADYWELDSLMTSGTVKREHYTKTQTDEAIAIDRISLESLTDGAFHAITDYACDNTTHGFSTGNVTLTAGDYLTVTETGTYPYFYKASPLPFDPKDITTVRMRLRRKSGQTTTWQGRLYWRGGNVPSFTNEGGHYQNSNVTQVYKDFIVVSWDLRTKPSWDDATAVRFDLSENLNTQFDDPVWEIDYIKFGDTLEDYTNSATLDQNFYTKTGADTAISTATTVLKSEVAGSTKPKLAWDFGSQNGDTLKGWTTTNITSSESQEHIKLTSKNSDPQFKSPKFSLWGGTNTKIQVKIKRTAGSGWHGACYYSTQDHNFDDNYKKSIPDPTIMGEYVIAEWDMYTLTAGGTDWRTHHIDQIRLDFGSADGDKFDIEWITIGRVAPPVGKANPLNRFIHEPFEDWILGNQDIISDSSAPDGTGRVLRLENGSYSRQPDLMPIVEGAKYRVKFWAKPSGSTAGRLYFCLRQFLGADGELFASGSTYNSGRKPYKAAVNVKYTNDAGTGHHDIHGNNWALYEGVYTSSDWLTGAKYFQPEFLDAYHDPNTETAPTGSWRISGFQLEEVTDEEILRTTVETHTESIDGLHGQYTVKIDNNGTIAGFGLANTATNSSNATSSFFVAADKFAVVPPTDLTAAEWRQHTSAAPQYYSKGDLVRHKTNGNTYDYWLAKIAHTANSNKKPSFPTPASGGGEAENAYWKWVSRPAFSVVQEPTTVTIGDTVHNVDSGVYMDGAFIKAASITAASIKTIDADTITTGSIDADLVSTGTLDVSKVNITGTSASGIDIKSAASGERMEIKSDSIKVYDAAGKLRVHIGNIG